jgi:hypothetical protein
MMMMKASCIGVGCDMKEGWRKVQVEGAFIVLGMQLCH